MDPETNIELRNILDNNICYPLNEGPSLTYEQTLQRLTEMTALRDKQDDEKELAPVNENATINTS